MNLSSNTFLIKDYIVDRKRIGKGSFSSIYKCQNRYTKKVFALKELVLEKSKKKNIKREIKILQKLNHKNIVKIYDIIIDTNLDNVYLIMDYYESGDLSKFLNKKPLKEKFCKKYIRQLSDGLKYLLDNQILHRDLKPQNILITNNYDIKITDFGLATEYSEKNLLNTLCGSPMYMAPEIICKKAYTYKSDLWSVGIIMFEMIHGYTPFRVNNFLELIKEIKKNQIKIEVNISIECKNLILELLIIDPKKRITWIEFFNNIWFSKDEINEDENKLMDIDFNNSLPNINNYNLNEKQFCSFRHKSIKDLEEENLEENLEFNFLQESIESSNELFLSANESIENNLDDNEIIKNETKFSNSKPIKIENKNVVYGNNSFVMVKQPDSINEFVLVSNNEIKTQSLPIRKKKTITQSVKEYMYSSMKLLKYSYDYLNPNSI